MATGDRRNTDEKPAGKKRKKLSQKEQSERFKATARELDVDETGDAFRHVLGKLLSTPKT